MTEIVKVFDHKSGRVVHMPAAEVTGMVEIAGLWMHGFPFDFGDGSEAVADPLSELVSEMCDAGFEILNWNFGFHKLMWFESYHEDDALQLAEVSGASGDIGVTLTTEGADDDPTFRVSFPREKLPEVYRRWRRWKEVEDAGG